MKVSVVEMKGVGMRGIDADIQHLIKVVFGEDRSSSAPQDIRL